MPGVLSRRHRSSGPLRGGAAGRGLGVNGTAATRLRGASRLDLQRATREILGEAWRGVAWRGVPAIVCRDDRYTAGTTTGLARRAERRFGKILVKPPYMCLFF